MEQITIQKLVEMYGDNKAAMIVHNQINQTIIMKQRAMRGARPVFNVLLKDPITGKLVISTDHVLRLQHIGKNGNRRDWFTESEIHAMARIMPGFDHYYEVRRAGYDYE